MRGEMKYLSVAALSLAVWSSNLTIVQAADTPALLPLPQTQNAPTQPGQWQFSASPYFWATGIRGTVGQSGLNTPLKSSFGNVLKELDFSFMGMIESRYDNYSLFADIMYAKISTGGETPFGIFSKSVDVTSQTFSGFFGAGYSLLNTERGHIDVVAGGRVWYASTDISIIGGLLDGRRERESATWVDAVGGLRGKYFLTDQLYLTGWGVVGAGQAKLDWDVAGAVGYQFKDSWSAVAGYRALGVDYNRDGFLFDVVQKGPILGLVYHF